MKLFSSKTLIIISSILLLLVIFASIFDINNLFNRIPKHPKETGAINIERVPAPELEQFYTLMDETPIETDIFTLTANYQKVKLNVYYKNDKPESREIFKLWLIDNGYGLIPESKVIELN